MRILTRVNKRAIYKELALPTIYLLVRRSVAGKAMNISIVPRPSSFSHFVNDPLTTQIVCPYLYTLSALLAKRINLITSLSIHEVFEVECIVAPLFLERTSLSPHLLSLRLLLLRLLVLDEARAGCASLEMVDPHMSGGEI